MFNQTSFISAFIKDVKELAGKAGTLRDSLAEAIASAPNARAFQKALYASAREAGQYSAVRKMWQYATSGKPVVKTTGAGQNEDLVKFLRASASALSKGGKDYPSEVFAMLVDCQLAFEEATAEAVKA